MLYAEIHSWLGWPSPKQAFDPEGAGAQVYAQFAQSKIQRALDSAHPGIKVNVGVIASDPNSDSSEAPLALVCDFPRAAREEVLDLVHRLAWNLSRTALLITLEPQRLIAWTCYQDPTQGNNRRICELPTPNGFSAVGPQQQRTVRDLLHWVNLITHRAQSLQPEKFPPDGRADALLLKNLRFVREELLKMGLPQDYCHDLLARIIFTQFLFHRKDSGGHSFFSKQKMQRLYEDKVLSSAHEDLASVLSHKTDTYALFRWMDERFNGDLFPGKETDNEKERDAAWKAERDAVSERHLTLLARLILGNLDVADKQHTLWPFYSFDTIPLEFISSVYEEFLTADERGNDKAYYTPSHLVDYVLDAVLPWNSKDWNVRILDPCCGSAIFLVKAFQRLIHRWRLAHPKGQEPLVTDLRPILENNLVGVDKNREAVRVACFSLYLAMADAIEPKHYITRENYKVFPRLRGTRLIHCDFFDEETLEIRTGADKERFDYVLGNAAWGDGSIEADPLPTDERKNYAKRIFNINATKDTKSRAQIWAKAHAWPVANNDIGPLFLAKAAVLVKSNGYVAMVNNAQILYRCDGLAVEFRKKLFTNFTFEEITNLSALRRELFSQAIGPSCILVFGPGKPEKQKSLHYYTPKATRSITPQHSRSPATPGFTIEPYDISAVSHDQAASETDIWATLSLGSNRDHALIKKLKRFPTLETLSAGGKVICRSGIILGDQKQELPALKNVPYFGGSTFDSTTFLTMDTKECPPWKQPLAATTYATNPEAFKSPQLLIKVTPIAQTGRFRAVRVISPNSKWGVVCTKSFFTVRDYCPEAKNVNRACVAYNSNSAAYFLHLTSGRSLYNTEMRLSDLRSVPIPGTDVDFANIGSFDEIDACAKRAFNLTTADWTLIEDFFEYVLPDALRKAPGPARYPTQRKSKEGNKEPELTQFAKTFSRVVKGTFGKNKAISATIFTEPELRKLPVRMLTLHLDSTNAEGVSIEAIEADGLLDKLTEFHENQLAKKTRNSSGSGLGFQRVAYFFHPSRENARRVMNLTIVKPDERRYWTRAMAMRDADQLAGAIAKAGMHSQSNA